ncbi:homing endonuclease associated repeat-containing protein [Natronorubrum bangense]|uniref:HNH endonuclease n=1 Tax=Natronorubrum bangense TaxID=61858 RepID=A0A4D6HPG6_9EURY|nr:HNH endonuclease [Natronorubrum bangense]QCC55843.1 HNH endonuclease [Natronorubrum bangense]
MTSEQECLESLREAAARLGESPTKAQYEELGLTPSASTILRVVGGWNAAKTKADLETEPSTGTRTAPKPEKVELPDGMEWEDLSQDQRWHYKHPDWNTERSLQRQNAHRAWANELQRTRGGCNRCAEQDPACLDFHHVDEDEKEMAVGKMISFGYSRDRIKAEIEKCIVLCANCHRKEHYNPPLD